YLKDILSLMQKNGISEFYYTHLPLFNANIGILFYGKIANNQLTITIVPTILLMENEKYIYEILLDETGFKISTRSKGNLIIKGKNSKWKLIPTENFFLSLPFDLQDYRNRMSVNDLNVK